PFQQLLAAAHRDRLQKLPVGHVGEAVFTAVDAHEALGPGIVGRDLVVRDRPVAVIEWTEAQAVASPAQRASADSFQKPVVGTIADAGKVVTLAAIGKQAPASTSGWQALTHPLLQVGIGG